MNNNQQNSVITKFPSNFAVLITSIFSIIIPSVVSIITFDELNIYLKVIICLSITCFVLFADTVFYFVKEREHYYTVCYLDKSIDLLQGRIKEIEDKLSNK